MASDARNRRLAEFLGLLSFGVSLMLLISLGTYNPSDPAPFFKAGLTGPARNFIGPIGAFLAELLVPQLFGFAALLIPRVLGWAGWSLFWCRPFDAPYTKGAGLLVMLLSTTGLLAMPSILAEVAFVSHPEEEQRLKETDRRERIAQGLFEGVRTYLEELNRTQTRQLTEGSRGSTVASGEARR